MRDQFLKLYTPAHNWENASPIGAGSLGAMVYGGVATERISYNEETIWDGGEIDTHIDDYYDKYLHIRKLFLEGKPYEAEKWAFDNFNDYFFVIKSYEAAGEVEVDLHFDSETESYSRVLDLKRGILGIDYEKYVSRYSREHFASHPARLVCTKLTCEKSMTGHLRYVRENIDSANTTVDGGTALMDYYCHTATSGKRFRVTIKVVTDGELEKNDENLILKNVSSVEIYFSCVTAFRDEAMDTMKYIANADRGFEALKSEHIADFSGIMGRSDIYVGDDGLDELSVGRRLRRLTDDPESTDRGLIALYFQFGKYLLVSSSREDTYAANLQGLWCDGLEAPWNSDYHTNINLQMNYWPAEEANIREAAGGLFNYMNEVLLPGGRKVARDNYHARGSVVHHVADIYGFAAAADGMWGLWPVGGAWLAYHMWEHYLYTGDVEFLRNTAYEFIRDSALFFFDTLFEGPDGCLHSGPSTSPENSYLVDVDGKKEMVFLTISPTMDIQIISGVLDSYAEVEKILGINPEDGARAREILARLPKMKIGPKGQLLEWVEDYEEWELGHRHISHSYGLYPAAQITRHTPEYFEAIKKSLEIRLANGGGHTGWSRGWLINLFARLKDGVGAYKNLRALFTKSTLYNLFDNHPPFQIDGNFGGCAAIGEMVMQSHEGFISLLPAISPEMKDGYFENLCARGGYTVSAEWADGKITSLTVLGDGSADVELPEGQTNVSAQGDGICINSRGRKISVPCGVKFTF